MSRILIVEDDDHIRTALRLMFEGEGYRRRRRPNGEDRRRSVQSRWRSDVAIVDIMLPGMSGFDTCLALRGASDMPIVIVSARDDTADVVLGLESGADDYVTKPFVPEELLARVRAHLRRRPEKARASVPIGELHVIPDEGVVRQPDGSELHLTSTEFRLLIDLAKATEKFSRERISSSGSGATTTSVTVDWSTSTSTTADEDRARSRDSSAPLTVRGTGYKLVI